MFKSTFAEQFFEYFPKRVNNKPMSWFHNVQMHCFLSVFHIVAIDFTIMKEKQRKIKTKYIYGHAIIIIPVN